jgi:hypothetical protein
MYCLKVREDEELPDAVCAAAAGLSTAGRCDQSRGVCLPRLEPLEVAREVKTDIAQLLLDLEVIQYNTIQYNQVEKRRDFSAQLKTN